MISHAAILMLAQAFTLVNGQLVDPYPMSTCDSAIAGLELQCPGSTGCCSGGAACCAGGCCPLTSNCINFGTVNEGCCPFGDSTNCGFGVTTFAPPACTDVSFASDRTCVGVDDTWPCPAEDGCDYANGGCIPYAAPSCTYDDDSAPQTTSPSDSTSTDSSTGDSSSSDSGSDSDDSTTTSDDNEDAASYVTGTGLSFALVGISMIAGLIL